MKFKLWYAVVWILFITIGYVGYAYEYGEYMSWQDHVWYNVWLVIPLGLYLYSNHLEKKKQITKMI